jgi:multimeric flavodoxin WrbA
MQQIEIFIGSPRKSGNTFGLAEMFKSHLDEKKFTVNTSFLYDFDIIPCLDCRACTRDKMQCALADEMRKIYDRLESADIIVIGTPIYWFGPTAKMKLMLDRLRPYFRNKKLAGKKAILFLPAGSGEADCDLTKEMFKRSFEALGIKLFHVIPAKAYNLGEVQNDNRAIKSLAKLSARLNRMAE